METPECDKLLEVHEESRVIGEFLDWANSRGIYLANFYEERGLVVDRRSHDQILADYYNIDLDKIEEERRYLLEMQREINTSMDLLGVLTY